MALVPKIEFQSINRDASEMYIKNITGAYNAVTNPTGYGTPNTGLSDISKIIFTVSSFTDAEVYSYDTEPKADVVAGSVIVITPEKLGAEAGYSFEDGVYDINEYDVTTATLSIDTASAGNKFITLSTPIIEAQYDEYNVLIDNNDNIYNINKTVLFNANRIDTIEQLKAGITSLAFGYRANVKAEVTVSMDYNLGTLATEECGCHEEERLIKLYFHKAMARIAMDNQDYKRANTLISGTFNRSCC